MGSTVSSAKLFQVGITTTPVTPTTYVPGPIIYLMEHNISVGNWKLPERTQLVKLFNRRLEVGLNQPNTISFSMHGDDPESLLLIPGETDVWWEIEGVMTNRHRLVSRTRNLSDQYTIDYVAVDYRGLLNNRVILSPDTFHPNEGDLGRIYDLSTSPGQTGWNIEAIAWDLIDNMQKQTGGDLGITKGIFPTTGVKFEVTFRDGQSILSCLDTLVQSNPGLEYNIDYNRKLNIYYPARGADRGVKLDYGGMIASATEAGDLRTDFANWMRTAGDIAFDPVVLPTNAASIVNSRIGRWDMTFNDPDLSTKDAISKAAAHYFSQFGSFTPKLDLTFGMGQWEGPNHVWVGDVVNVYIQRGDWDLETTTRVQTLTVEVPDTGATQVTASVGLQDGDPYRYLTRTVKRLTER